MVEQNAIVRFVGGALVIILRRTTGLLRSKNRAVDQWRAATFHGGVNRYRCCGNAVMEKSTTKSFSRQQRGRKETSRIFYNAVSRSVRCVTAIIRVALFLSSFRSPDDRFVRSHTSSDVCVSQHRVHYIDYCSVTTNVTVWTSPGRDNGPWMLARKYRFCTVKLVDNDDCLWATFPIGTQNVQTFPGRPLYGQCMLGVLYGRKHNPATNHTRHAQNTRVFRQSTRPISNNIKPMNFYFNVAQRFLSCIIFFRCLFQVFRISTDFKKRKERTRKNVE